MKIDKIKKLDNRENFFQINFNKGYKYIDTAGEILNLYSENMTRYSIDTQQLIIQNPTNNFEELKVATDHIWGHKVLLKNFTSVNGREVYLTFLQEAKKILKITEPSNVTRIGWRSNLLLKLPSGQKSLRKTGSNITEVTGKFQLSQEVWANLRIAILERKDDLEKSRLYECRGCIGRDLTHQACEVIMKQVAEVRILEKFTGVRDTAKLPDDFCGDRYVRDVLIPQPTIPISATPETREQNTRIIQERSNGFPF